MSTDPTNIVKDQKTPWAIVKDVVIAGSLIFLGLMQIAAKGCSNNPFPPPTPPPLIAFVEESVAIKPGKMAHLQVETQGKGIAWDFPAGLDAHTWSKDAWVTGLKGVYVITVWTSINNEPPQKAKCLLTIGDPSPDPSPDPQPTPLPSDSFAVLVLFDTKVKLTAEQQLILLSPAVRDYLDSKCGVGADKQRNWRMLDVSTDLSNAPQFWKDAASRPHTSLPWIVIGKKDDGYEGPLPKNVDETLALLKKYGG